MELVDAVDSLDRVVAQVPRAEAANLGANVRVVQIYLFDRAGRLLIHELSAKKRYAGAWGASVAGGVKAGETPLKAARRELREEMGIRRAVLRPLGKIRVQDEGITKFVSVFSSGYAGPLNPDPSEIAGVEWVAPDAVFTMMHNGERRFTPTFRWTFEHMRRAFIA